MQHSGNWDPEPGAWPRYVRWFQRETSVNLEVKNAEPTTLTPAIAPFATLTTVAAPVFSDEQLKGIAAYVNAGGVLFVDPTGGADAAKALREQLLKAFDGPSFESVPDDHPLLNASGEGMINLGKPRMRSLRRWEARRIPSARHRNCLKAVRAQ